MEQSPPRVRAFAKALHYKEVEFTTNPGQCAEALIDINKELEQAAAAVGVIEFARQQFLRSEVPLKESWFEKLDQWDTALLTYERSIDAFAKSAAMQPRIGPSKSAKLRSQLLTRVAKSYFRLRPNIG